MKRIIFFVAWFCSFLFILTFPSCREKESLPAQLEQAEKMMNLHPDSALHLLKEIPSPEKLSKGNYAVWCLSVTEAEDKNYIQHTSDTLITRALAYFEKQKDPVQKGKALFYAGQVYAEMEQPEKAVSFYLKAKKTVETSTDYTLLYLICSNLGMKYAYRPELKGQAKSCLNEAYDYAVLSGDSTYIAHSLSELGRIYERYEQWDSVAYFYQEAIRIAFESRSHREYAIAKGEISRAYIRSGAFKQAIESLQEAKAVRIQYNLGHLAQTDLSLGDTYRRMGEYDSAVYYLRESLKTDNIYTRQAAYWYLYSQEKAKENYKAAIDYNENFISCSDSVRQISYRKELLEMQRKYDHEKLLNINSRLKMERDKWISWTLLILLLSIGLFAFFQRKLFKKEQQIRRIEKNIQEYSTLLYKNEAVIRRNNELISALSSQQEIHEENDHRIEIEAMQEANGHLQEENRELKDKIQSHTQAIQLKEADWGKTLETIHVQMEKLLYRERELTDLLARNMDVLKRLKGKNRPIKETEWPEIFHSVDLIYDRFTERLRTTIPSFSSNDIQYCCLIKLHLPTPAIANLMAVSPTSVTKKKQRLRERIRHCNPLILDNKQSVETFLWEF